MKKLLLFEMKSIYRDNMRVYGYLFGADDLESCDKTVAVVSGMRGNEYTQIYEASQLVKQLEIIESEGGICEGRSILVIPVANPYSVNSEKRFWPADNTDLNRMFPGYELGETTQRAAASLFSALEGFRYGIHLTSHYISGNFVPHVSIQDTGRSYTESAKAFGLQYVRLRRPTFYDTTTLNYNWQIWETLAYSIYGGDDRTVDTEQSASVVNAILNFMDNKGVIRFDHHRGYISSVITDDDICTIKSEEAGFFRCCVKAGEVVHRDQKLAEILDTGDGHVKSEILSPSAGTVFFIHSSPLAFAKEQLMLLVK